jgi:hypothetical protein
LSDAFALSVTVPVTGVRGLGPAIETFGDSPSPLAAPAGAVADMTLADVDEAAPGSHGAVDAWPGRVLAADVAPVRAIGAIAASGVMYVTFRNGRRLASVDSMLAKCR